MKVMMDTYPASHMTNRIDADTLQPKHRSQQVVNECMAALKADENDFSIWLKMSDTLLKQRDPAFYPLSLACCEKSLQLHAGNPKAFIKKGTILKKLGRQEEAIAAVERALDLAPNLPAARFTLLDILCPVLYEKEEDIASSRTAYARQLGKLDESVELCSQDTIDRAAQAVGIYPFHLGYQGCNDKDLQRRYGELVCRIQAARYPQWSIPVLPPPHAVDEPLRVGFVSGFFHYHATWKVLTRGWLLALDKKRFALYGYYTGDRPDACTGIARQAFTRFVENDFSLGSLCRKILADKLHVLIFPEIGMNSLTMRLSALRLAPVQCASWGHSTTSGLPTMDYFLSNDLMEPADGDGHYTETLVRLPNLGIHYSPLDIEAMPHRTLPGLKKDVVRYLCIQSLFKYLPQYDDIFPRIAQKTGDCQFLFITDRMSKPVTNIFRRRLKTAFSEYGMNSEDYAVFLPKLDDDAYFSLHRQGDVFLDSIGWSGCNTTLEAIACNLPVVTLPGSLMRGRQTMGILKMMGMTATIADSVDRYVEIAAKLGTDCSWRKQIREQVAANKYKLYADNKCIEAFEAFLEKAVADARQHWSRQTI